MFSNRLGVVWARTSADLFKTAFDLLVSVTLFLGRFDMRTMQVLTDPHVLFSAFQDWFL